MHILILVNYGFEFLIAFTFKLQMPNYEPVQSASDIPTMSNIEPDGLPQGSHFTDKQPSPSSVYVSTKETLPLPTYERKSNKIRRK